MNKKISLMLNNAFIVNFDNGNVNNNDLDNDNNRVVCVFRTKKIFYLN